MATRKVKFYKLVWEANPDTGKLETRFLREVGNQYQHSDLELVTYWATDGKVKTWYMVERSSGAAIAKGATRVGITEQFEKMWKNNPGAIRESIKKCIEKYGLTPDHRATEVF